MKPVWKWMLGILLALFVIGWFAAPYLMYFFLPNGGYYGMMGYGGHMPMHYGFGGGMMGGFGMGFGLFSGLIQLGVLVLIVMAIIWLYNAIRNQNASKN